jgi:hypothetical protein
VATRSEIQHRDRINTDSSPSRDRFVKKLVAKLGIERDTLFPLIEPQLTKLAQEIDEKHPAPLGRSEKEIRSQATQAAGMADDWELWHTPSMEAYATIPVDNHKENWLIRSHMLKRFIAKQYFDEQSTAMNADALAAAVTLLEAKALFEGQEHPVHVRLAEHDGAIFLNLCNPTWQAVKVTQQGWEIVDEPPVRFRRSRGMLALATPERGGDIDLLRDFLNVDDNTFRLIVVWLVAALRPRGPYPILALFAEHGSGKSTAGRLLRALIDPNAAPLRAEPKDGRDLVIAANNSWYMAFDNLSYVAPWLSDCLCRLSTGGGFATRELYTDQDEIIFDSQRPVLLTSIEEVATRSDLLDRCLIVWMSEIPEDRRRSEEKIYEAFGKVQQRILGALLDAVAIALQRIPSISLPGLPRMADFAMWASAAETAFGWPDGTFMAAYQANRASANEVALEASVIASPLLEMLESEGEWTGSSAELLKLLEERLGDQVRRLAGWPKGPRALSGHLKRLAPNLRAAGWAIDQDRTSKRRSWVIRRATNDAKRDGESRPSSFASSEDECEEMQTDAGSCNSGLYDANDTNDANAGRTWNPDRY